MRNRVRRRLREALQVTLRELPVSATCKGYASFDMVLVARPEAAHADYWQLKKDLKRALTRAKLLGAAS